MQPVIFRRQARTEFDEAGDWYEKERPGLGMEFMSEIQLLIQRIASTPEQFASFLANEVARWRKVVKESGIHVKE